MSVHTNILDVLYVRTSDMSGHQYVINSAHIRKGTNMAAIWMASQRGTVIWSGDIRKTKMSQKST
jgi:hypothetical protein